MSKWRQRIQDMRDEIAGNAEYRIEVRKALDAVRRHIESMEKPPIKGDQFQNLYPDTLTTWVGHPKHNDMFCAVVVDKDDPSNVVGTCIFKLDNGRLRFTGIKMKRKAPQ